MRDSQEAIYEVAMECFAGNIGELEEQAEGVKAMAATYRKAEDTTAIEVNRGAVGLQLPGELVSLLSMLGYTWPQADEEKLFEMGRAWLNFVGSFSEPLEDAKAQARRVWTGNQGEGIEAFRQAWPYEIAWRCCTRGRYAPSNRGEVRFIRRAEFRVRRRSHGEPSL